MPCPINCSVPTIPSLPIRPISVVELSSITETRETTAWVGKYKYSFLCRAFKRILSRGSSTGSRRWSKRWYSVSGNADSMRLSLGLFNVEETIFPTEFKFNCVISIAVYQ